MEITNKKSVYQHIYLISNFIKIIRILQAQIFFLIILHENKLKILYAQIFFLSYFIKITKNNQYTQSH